MVWRIDNETATLDFNETTGKGSVGAVALANMRMIAAFAAALATSGFTGSARAQAIIDVTQVGSNVDVTLSGSINTTVWNTTA
jgi:hypothetical protein